MSGCGRKSLRRLVVVSFFMVLAACGGQDEAPDEPGVNLPPVAVLDGPDEAESGEMVVLDGSASHDPDGDMLIFEWSQPDGQDIALAIDDTDESASFIVPAFDEETTLQFIVRVSDGELQHEVTRNITITPSGFSQQVSLDFALVRMSAHEGGDPLEEVDGKLRVEILDANGDVVDVQHALIEPGLPAVFEIPEEGEQFRYRVIAWSDDAYYFLPGSTDYVFGREYSLSELQVQEMTLIRLDVHDHEATAYLRTMHVVTENDPEYPNDEVGTRITETKIHVAGRNADMSHEQCEYSLTDFGFQRPDTGVPVSEKTFTETFGRCADVDNVVYRLKLSPDAWETIRENLDAEWTSFCFYGIDSPDDDFGYGIASGGNLYLDGQWVE